MDAARRAFVSFMFCAFLFVGKADAQHLSSGYKCQEPKEGLWHIEERFPAGAFEPEVLPPGTNAADYVLIGAANIKFVKAFNVVYKGEGHSEAYLPFPAQDVPLQIVGLFDQKSCSLSGTIFNTALDATSTFHWYAIGGSVMSGASVVSVGGLYPTPFIGFHNATFLG